MKSKMQVDSWDASNEIATSKYAAALIQLPTSGKDNISQDPSTWKCEMSGERTSHDDHLSVILSYYDNIDHSPYLIHKSVSHYSYRRRNSKSLAQSLYRIYRRGTEKLGRDGRKRSCSPTLFRHWEPISLMRQIR